MENIEIEKFLDPSLKGQGEEWKLETLFDMIPEEIKFRSIETHDVETWIFAIRKVRGIYEIQYNRYGWEGIEELIPYPEWTEEDKEDIAYCGTSFRIYGRCGIENKNLYSGIQKIISWLFMNQLLPEKYLFGDGLKKEILKKVLDEIKENYVDSGIFSYITKELYRRFGIYYSGSKVKNIFFPTHTIDNDPVVGESHFWWPKEEKGERVKFLEEWIRKM